MVRVKATPSRPLRQATIKTQRRAGGIGLHGGEGVWSSALGAADLAALASIGLKPAGMVQAAIMVSDPADASWGVLRSPPPGPGALAARAGYSRLYPCPHGSTLTHLDGYNYERLVYQQSVRRALAGARAALAEQAGAAGGHGVVVTEVRRRRSTYPPGTSVTMVGTAIRRPGAAPLAEPFTTHLSGVDLVKALRAGWVPTDLVVTAVSMVVGGGCRTASQLRRGAAGEVTQFGEAMSDCGRLVVADLEAQAARRGDGLVGLEVEVHARETRSRSPLLEGAGLGSAVRHFAARGNGTDPLAVVALRDRPQSPWAAPSGPPGPAPQLA